MAFNANHVKEGEALRPTRATCIPCHRCYVLFTMLREILPVEEPDFVEQCEWIREVILWKETINAIYYYSQNLCQLYKTNIPLQGLLLVIILWRFYFSAKLLEATLDSCTAIKSVSKVDCWKMFLRSCTVGIKESSSKHILNNCAFAWCT